MPHTDQVFSAIADPTRRAILARLAEGEATVNELAVPFSISQPAISRHIKVLEQAGLILRRIDGAHPPAVWLGQLREGLKANYNRLDHDLEQNARPKGEPE